MTHITRAQHQIRMVQRRIAQSLRVPGVDRVATKPPRPPKPWGYKLRYIGRVYDYNRYNSECDLSLHVTKGYRYTAIKD